MGTPNVIRPVGVHPEALPPDFDGWDNPGKLTAALPGPVRRVLSSTGLNLQPAKPHMGAQGNPAIASVDPGSPNTINVEDPARFNQSGTQTLSHEAVHLWHNNLPPHIQAQIPEDDQKDPYNYGGAEGLQSMRDQGMKLWNLPREKAATVVQYYASQGGKDAPKAIRDVYEPWVKDMSDVPLSTIKPTDPDAQGLETSPRPPQGQMYSTKVFAKGESDAKPLTPSKNGDKSAMQKGSPVTLPDGTTGKIMHVLENMRTARVRTDEGKKVHVRLSALKVIPHVIVQSHARRIPER